MPSVELRFVGVDESGLSLSGLAYDGQHVFVAPDEGASVVRMRRDPVTGGYQQDGTYPVADYVDVPGAGADELDLESLDIAGGYLWLAGSHGAVRTRVGRDETPETIAQRLARIAFPPSRRVLARIPLVPGRDGPEPARTGAGPDGSPLHAGLVEVAGEHSLVTLLARDEHLGPFAGLPGKDNGLDVEGMAVVGDRVLLGLRGPVLRGWAVVVEIEPVAVVGDPVLRLRAGVAGDARYRKHFLQLEGLGIRDLARVGDDLLVLAGPTMLLDGPSRIVRVRGGAAAGVSLSELPGARRPEQLGPDLEVGDGNDHPEAITVTGSGDGSFEVLLTYDSPRRRRRTAAGVLAEVGSFPLS